MAETAEVVSQDLQTGMGEAQANGARWFTLERILPAYHDNIAATGFIEELTVPVAEGDVLGKWGGGTYRMTAKAVGTGRGKKKVVWTKEFDLSGPPRAYPGADGKPVQFPSVAAAAAEASEQDDPDFEDDDEWEADEPHARGGNGHRHYNMGGGGAGYGPGYRGSYPPGYRNGFGGVEGGGIDPASRIRQIGEQQRAQQQNVDAMRLIRDAAADTNATLSQQLQTREREVASLRDAVLARDDRAVQPMQQAITALQQRMEQQRADFEAEVRAIKTINDQQLSQLNQRHESDLRMLKERHESELRSLQARSESDISRARIDTDKARDEGNQRVRDAQTAAQQHLTQMQDLIKSQYETRVAILTSERDAALRRADDARLSAMQDISTRVGDERTAAQYRETMLREMLTGQTTAQVTPLSQERDRLRDEVADLRRQLEEARKAADPQTSLRNVAAMADTMKSLGLVPTGDGGKDADPVPEDMFGKIAAYAPKIMAAAEPVLRRADAARAANVQMQETAVRERMHARQLLAATQGAAPPPRPRQLPATVPQGAAPSPVAPAPVPHTSAATLVEGAAMALNEEAKGIKDLLGALDGAFVAGMTPDQVAIAVQSNLATSSPEAKQILDELLSKPASQVADELSTAAETLGYPNLSTPRAMVWMQQVHATLEYEGGGEE